MNETLRAVARARYGFHVWLHKDVVQCVISRLLWCPDDVVFATGALRWVLQGRSQRLPALKGDTQRVATPDILFRPPGRQCRRFRTVRPYSLRIPWIATAVVVSGHARASPALAESSSQRYKWRPSAAEVQMVPLPSKCLSPRGTNGPSEHASGIHSSNGAVKYFFPSAHVHGITVVIGGSGNSHTLHKTTDPETS